MTVAAVLLAFACPDFTGRYSCTDGIRYDLVDVFQTREGEIESYHFSYPDLGAEDVIRASASGISDGEWVSSCTPDGKLRSVRVDGGVLSVWSKDPKTGKLLRAENERLRVSCHPIQGR